ncbi:hypothetical protein FIV42_10635 [Persicimonas caeni]|uniref:Lipoprotein n=1 Tax=Persicimonas caeni TaxID=2292766 RepID=A0A4Y6PT21_PERCE|nr:hypothetical protein [Persicimonas caeni]QDG51177.1 hypothetical protein FIV42_10635 [Persicimonas caeni]QED32398.1 hypothetical protein FRD00_10630 [Persicimonas caeni]
MTFLRHRAYLMALCVCLLLGAACSDDPDESPGELVDSGQDVGADTADVGVDADVAPQPDTGPDADPDPDTGPDADTGPDTDTGPDADTGTATGLRLEGTLVPNGGLSMSRSFTLSGRLSPGMPTQKSTSASFALELTPATGKTDDAN